MGVKDCDRWKFWLIGIAARFCRSRREQFNEAPDYICQAAMAKVIPQATNHKVACRLPWIW